MNFRPQDRAGEEPRIDIAPLVDVVFLLLIFFLLTTTFVTRSALQVDLPASGAEPTPPQAAELTVGLTADGRIVYEDRTLTPDALAVLLAARAEADPDTTVVLEADQAVPHGRVVEVMELARRAGLTRLRIATEQAPGAP